MGKGDKSDKLSKEEKENKLSEFSTIKDIATIFGLLCALTKFINKSYPLYPIIKNPKFQILFAIAASFGLCAINDKDWDKGSKFLSKTIFPALSIAFCTGFILYTVNPKLSKMLIGSISAIAGIGAETLFNKAEKESKKGALQEYVNYNNLKYANNIVKSAIEAIFVTTICSMLFGGSVAIKETLIFSSCWIMIKEMIDYSNYVKYQPKDGKDQNKGHTFTKAALKGKNPFDPEKLMYSVLDAFKYSGPSSPNTPLKLASSIIPSSPSI